MLQSFTVKPVAVLALTACAQLFIWLSHDRCAALAKSGKVEPSTLKGRCVSPVLMTCFFFNVHKASVTCTYMYIQIHRHTPSQSK